MTEAINNIADWRVTLDGQDLTGKMRPRLISLSISEKRGDEADQLDIVLDDSDGGLQIPPEGAQLSVAIGWKQGRDVTAGLVEKGSFTVDDVSHSGPPDQITIKARSADFTSTIRNRRDQSWKDTTLGRILNDIAARNGLTANISPALAATTLKAISQSRESDIAFLSRLGGLFDAVATVKNESLIFKPIGSNETPSGKPLPALSITRASGDRHSWQRQKRDGQDGVSADWHDGQEAKKKRYTAGEAKGAKRLRKTYPDEASAKRAASTERDRLKRAPESFDIRLALGRPDASPETRVTVTGFKGQLDGTSWLIAEVTHRLDKGGGLVSEIKMELFPKSALRVWSE